LVDKKARKLALKGCLAINGTIIAPIVERLLILQAHTHNGVIIFENKR
jgi:hypothetical protein